MKPIKIVLAVAGVLGLLAVFALPYVSMERMSLKFWDFRLMPEGRMSSGLLDGPKQVYVAILGFAMVFAAGMQAITTKHLARGGAILGGIGCIIALATQGVRSGMSSLGGAETAIGGKLLFLAAVVGLVAAIIGAVKPEPQAA